MQSLRHIPCLLLHLPDSGLVPSPQSVKGQGDKHIPLLVAQLFTFWRQKQSESGETNNYEEEKIGFR